MRAILAAAAFCVAQAADLKPADLKPIGQAGYKTLVASHKGKVLLVNFWATYCVPCRKEMPAFVALAAKYGAKGLVLATITADEAEQEPQARKFLEQTKVPGPVYIRRPPDDENFAKAVDAKWSGALPLTVLYDKAGRKVKVVYGEADLKELEAAILKLL